MGRDARSILGGLAIGAGFLFPGLGAIGTLLKIGGFLIMPSARQKGKSGRQEGAQFSATSTVQGLPIVYGTARFAPGYADTRVDESSTDDKDLWIVLPICHGGRRTGGSGGINAVTKVWFDGELAVDGGVVEAGFSGFLDYYEHLGTDDQNVDAAINAVFPTEWPATSKGRQVAYIVLNLTYDLDVYPNDLPNIVVEVEGNQVYDHRDTNWKHSTNPSLCIRDYMLSGVFGANITESTIDEDWFDDAANFCDELVTIPNGAGGSTTQKRFECNGTLDPTNTPEENLEALKTSCRGEIIFQGGKYRLWIPQNTNAETFELTEDNIIGDVQYASGGIDYAANIMRGLFIDADQEYRPNQIQFPEAGATNDYLTADNDFESPRDMELPFTTDEYMTQQICQVALNESRQDITCVLMAKEEALKLEVGVVVKVTLSTPGWSQKEFWVIGLFIGIDDELQVALREYDDSAYAYTTMSDKPAAPDTNLPSLRSISAPIGLTLLSDGTTASNPGEGSIIPRIKVTWAKPPNEPFMKYTEIFARLDGESDWISKGQVDVRDVQEFFVLDVDSGETWDVAVQAVNNIGVRSILDEDSVVVSDGGFANPIPDNVNSVDLSLEADDLDVEFADGEKDIQWTLINLVLDVEYAKDARFKLFEFRLYNALDTDDQIVVETAVGEDLGGDVYRLANEVSRRTGARDGTWTAEVRVRNIDGQVSAAFVSDSATYVPVALDVDADGARRGKLATLPDGRVDPDLQQDDVQKRGRTLISGDGTPTGQSGTTGSGDSNQITDQEVMCNTGDDSRKLSAGAVETVITPSGNLGEDVGQVTGGETRRLASGHQGGTAKDGDAVVFDPAYNNVPTVIFTPKGFVPYDPDDNLDWDGGGFVADQVQYQEIEPLNLSASGFDMRARLRLKAAQTGRTDDFADGAGRILDAIGETREANLDPAAAAADLYTIHFKVELEAENLFGQPVDALLNVAIDTNDGGGWVERLVIAYSLYQDELPSASHTWVLESRSITVSGLALDDDVRLRLKSEARGPKTAWVTMEVTAFNKDTDGDAENGVTYTTAADAVADCTPDVEDGVPWEAFEVT